MTKEKRLFLTLFFIIIFSCFNPFSYSKDSSNTVVERMEKLEAHKENLDERFNIRIEELKEKFKIKSKAIDLKIKQIDDKLRSDYDYLKLVAWTFGSITLLTLIVSIISISTRVHRVAVKKIDEKFDRLIDDQKTKLIQLIRTKSEECQLRKNQCIRVFNPAGSSNSFLENFFKRMEFTNINYFNNIENLDDQEYDLILINDEDSSLEEDRIIILHSKISKEKMFFYFGPNRVNFPSGSLNVAYANSRVQLYGNLINALRYQILL